MHAYKHLCVYVSYFILRATLQPRIGIMQALNLRTLESRRDEVPTKLTQLGRGTAVTKTGFPDLELMVLSYQLASLLGGRRVRRLRGTLETQIPVPHLETCHMGTSAPESPG